VDAGGIPANATPPATAAALAEAGQIAKDCRDSGLLTVIIGYTGVLRLLTFQIVHVQDAQRVLVHVASISRASVAPVHSASPFNSYFMANRTRKQKRRVVWVRKWTSITISLGLQTNHLLINCRFQCQM